MIGLIFANGNLQQTAHLHTLVDQAKLIVAADGGANHCRSLGIVPDILVGDLDSIDRATLNILEQEDTAIYRHPSNKDATDLELALDLAIAKGASIIWLLGVLGGRWDMSLSNIMLGANKKYAHSDIRLLGEDCVMHIMRAQKTYNIEAKPGQTVSLLPLGGDVEGLNLHGFQYPLRDHTAPLGTSLGLSNVIKSEGATVTFRSGMLLLVQLLSKPL